MVDIWSLRVLVAVADHGSFSAAGASLSLTQPAVSRQIAGLERSVGSQLFRRGTRGVTPTLAGAAAIDLARNLVAQVEAFDATMRWFAGEDGGQLRLAGFASVNTSLVPTAIRHYADDHPAVAVTLHHIEPFDVIAAVRDGRIDVALLTSWQLTDDPQRARHDAGALLPDTEVDGIDLTPLCDEELLLALPADHRLARRRRVPLAELRGERWVEGAPPDCLGPIPRLAEAIGEPPEVAYFCDDWNGKHALVAAGAGIMFVPTLAGHAVRADVVLRPTTPRLPTRRLYAATPRPPFCTPPAQAMVDLLVRLVPDPATGAPGAR